MSETILNVSGVSKRFGGLQALSDVGIKIERGQVYGLIGPNGAGKTTFFNLVAGTHPPTSGRIVFEGRDVTGMRPDHVARIGIARTFQTTHLFDNATVLDNLIVGHRLRTKSGLWDVLANTRRLRDEERLCRDKALEALDFVGLSHVANRIAADITQEERKRVAFALALAAHVGRQVERKAIGVVQLEGNSARKCTLTLSSPNDDSISRIPWKSTLALRILLSRVFFSLVHNIEVKRLTSAINCFSRIRAETIRPHKQLH